MWSICDGETSSSGAPSKSSPQRPHLTEINVIERRHPQDNRQKSSEELPLPIVNKTGNEDSTRSEKNTSSPDLS